MRNADKEIPKTDLILSHIAEHGPKTEYALYKELPKLSHGTIHYVLTKLTESYFLSVVKSKRKETRPKKLYHLTFIGATAYLSWFVPVNLEELTEKEIQEFNDRFDKEIHYKIMKFLTEQGSLLKYPPFEEINWLVEHYPGITRDFLSIADLLCHDPPEPYKSPLLLAIANLINKKHSPNTEENKHTKKASLYESENDAYREKFTEYFFQIIALKKHTGKTNNRNLRLLAEETLSDKQQDLKQLERIVSIFSK